MIKIDSNIDQVYRQIAMLESKTQNEPILEARKELKAIARNNIKNVKKETPKKTGKLQKSIKMKSRSRRGKTQVSVVWDSPYGYKVNFSENKSNGFKNTAFEKIEQQVRTDATNSIQKVLTSFFNKNGINVK